MKTKICSCCGQEIKETFDWSLMPVDTVVEMKTDDPASLRYFAGVNKMGQLEFYASGRTSTSAGNATYAPYVPLRSDILGFKNNPILPWFGGECPVYPDVRVKMWLRDTSGESFTDKARVFKWKHEGCRGDIIAYQIVDQEIPS